MPAVFLRKYGTGTGANVPLPMVKAGAVDFATSSDWTPASGDVKVSKDGGSQANIGTLPTYTNGDWVFVFSDAELQCKVLSVRIVDSATKAVEDSAFNVETYGHASAMYQADLSAANLPANVTQFGGSNITSSGGRPEVNATHWGGTAVASANVLIDGAITAAKIASDAITDAKVASDVTIASVTGNVGGNVTGTIGGLSTQAKADVNAEADAALADAGVTTTVTGRIDAAISSRLASASYTAPLDAAGTRSAVGLASANLDTQLGTIDNNVDEVLTDTDTTIPGMLVTIAGYIDTEIAAIKAKTDNLPSDPADQSAVEAAITAATSGLATASSVGDVQSAVDALPTLAEFLAGGDVDGFTLEQSLKLILSACAAKLSGAATTTITIRAADDSKDRITATVDSDGNRSAVTLDATG